MSSNHIALILVEGETEEVFFKHVSDLYFSGIPKKIKNLKGNYNINQKILDSCTWFSENNPKKTFDVYICVDQEREGTPIYNENYVNGKIIDIQGYVDKIDVIANLMLESLFFIDIENIFTYLRTQKNKRNVKKYSNFRILTHRDLTRLFESNGKQYYKGHRCEPLVKNLNIIKIVGKAKELQLLIDEVTKRHEKNNR